jgi:hypothetical protein
VYSTCSHGAVLGRHVSNCHVFDASAPHPCSAFVVYGVQCVSAWRMAHGAWCMVYYVSYIVHSVQCTIRHEPLTNTVIAGVLNMAVLQCEAMGSPVDVQAIGTRVHGYLVDPIQDPRIYIYILVGILVLSNILVGTVCVGGVGQ